MSSQVRPWFCSCLYILWEKSAFVKAGLFVTEEVRSHGSKIDRAKSDVDPEAQTSPEEVRSVGHVGPPLVLNFSVPYRHKPTLMKVFFFPVCSCLFLSFYYFTCFVKNAVTPCCVWRSYCSQPPTHTTDATIWLHITYKNQNKLCFDLLLGENLRAFKTLRCFENWSKYFLDDRSSAHEPLCKKKKSSFLSR